MRCSATNDYCDNVFASWRADPGFAPNQTSQDCSDCNLGVQQIQLNSPFGYDTDFASDFASLTSSCSKVGYSVTSPAAYGTTATGTTGVSGTITPTSSPQSTSACASTYAVQQGDLCNDIAKSNGISTFSLLHANGLGTTCDNFPTNGTTLCIPKSKCTTHQVAYNDTCDSIIGSYDDLSSTKLLTW